MRTRDRSAERGGAVMEVALLMPFFLVAAVGAADFGRAVYQDLEVQSAAYAGAQQGTQSSAAAEDTDAIHEAVLDYLGDGVAENDIDTEVERSCSCEDDTEIDCDSESCTDGSTPYVYVRVKVDRQFQTLFEYPGIPSSLLLSHEVKMRAR